MPTSDFEKELELKRFREETSQLAELVKKFEADSLTADGQIVYQILLAEKACERGELNARLFKSGHPDITNKRLFKACVELEKQGKAASKQVEIRCESSPSHRPWFRYSSSIDPQEAEAAIKTKAALLAQHYDNTKVIGDHAENLVKKVCEDLDYDPIHLKKKVSIPIPPEKKVSYTTYLLKKVRIREIDIFAKHPSNEYWQAISVKNWRDPITPTEVTEIVETAGFARKKWRKWKTIRPALVASKAYPNAVLNNYDVPIAVYEKQVAPESYRELYEALNDKLAFDVEITDNPTDKMRENIQKYIRDHKYKLRAKRMSLWQKLGIRPKDIPPKPAARPD